MSNPPFVFMNDNERALWRDVYSRTANERAEQADAAVLIMRDRDISPTSATTLDIQATLRAVREALAAITMAVNVWRERSRR